MTSLMLRRILLLCFFISGATGLVYEVVWARYLTVFIGGTAMAHTIVLATFMGGLALGNAWLGKWADRVTNKLLLYAFLEFGIGLVCLIFPEFFALLGKAYISMAAGSTPGSISLTLLKTVLAILAILPPCVLMGGTLPVLTKAIVGQLSKVGTRIGLIYAINTAGALAGIFLAGFVLLEQFGLSMSIRISAVANIVLGLVFYLLSRTHSDGAADADSDEDSDDAAFEYSAREIRWTVAIAALSGMFTMILEVVWIRLVAVVMGSSTYSFSIMLLGFIGGLCFGGALVSVIMRRDRDAVPILVAVLSGLAAVLVLIIPFYEQLPYFFNILNSWFEDRESGFVLFLGGQVCFVMLLTLVPTTLIGMVLPLATRVATQRISVLGATVGSVFSINTIGTLIGAALGGLVLIPNLGLDVTYRVVACGNALMAFLLWTMVGRPRTNPHKLRATAGLALVVALLMLIPQWNKIVLTVGVFRNGPRRVAASYEEFKQFYSGRELLFYEDGKDDTITVIRMPNGQTDLVVNAKSDATDGADMMTQRLIGQVGMILRPHSRDVLVVGLGSGVSVNSVLTHPVDSVDVVEISESVVRASDYFKHVNNNALGDPRVTLHVADAKEVLKLNPDKKWDLVVSQPTNPWIVGVGSLFAEEYWRDIQTHMVDDGLLVQWVQNYEMNDPLQEIIFQTFGKVFPHAP
ncbi:MAG TPA: hypothetical protein EYN06_10835 [Myxococcales bacterium]|nr:hypothetical protein [Myxococcales bacterium]